MASGSRAHNGVVNVEVLAAYAVLVRGVYILLQRWDRQQMERVAVL